MGQKKIIGFVLLGVGIVLLVMGFNAYDSASSQLSRAVSGNPSDNAMMLLLGGVACTIGGALMAFTNILGK